MSDQMITELGPRPVEVHPSVDALSAAADLTVSDSSKRLSNVRRGRAGKIVAMKATLVGAASSLLISCGFGNTEQPIVVPIQEPPSITETFTPATSTPETAPAPPTPEKQELTDIEFVSNLLDKYLNLDADPKLSRLKDKSLLAAELTKSFLDLSSRGKTDEALPLGTFKPPSSPYGKIEYMIPSANLRIALSSVGTFIGFPMDENGNIIPTGDPRLWTLQPKPTKEELDRLVVSGVENFTKLLKDKPGSRDWTVDLATASAIRLMSADVDSSDGASVRYSVGGIGETPLQASILVRQLSSDTTTSSSITETVDASEKEKLEHVEYVKNLLGKYLDLDADPRLKRLKDAPYVVLLDKKLSNLGPKDLYAEANERVSLAVITSPTGPTGEQVTYEISDLSLRITLDKQDGKVVGKTIYFGTDKEGRIKKTWEDGTDDVYPDAETLNKKVLDGAEQIDKYLRYKPGSWSVGQGATYPLRVMEAIAGLPDGSTVSYSVGTTGNQPITVFIHPQVTGGS